MNCEQAHELIPDYLGKEITREQTNALAAHLKGCPACREELNALAGVQSILRHGWPDEEMPKSLRLERPRSSWDRFGRFLIPGEWPRALAVGVVSTLLFLGCVSLLAFWKTEIDFSQGHFKISFNAPVSAPSSTELAQSVTPVSARQNHEELEKIVDTLLVQSEQRQNVKVEQLLLEVRAEMNAHRTADMQKISQALKYLELTQGEVWKASARNTSYLDALARQVYVKTSSTN
ncbi:MAG: zf-HC2 domain-containing protein [Terriglobia bacterium]